MSDEPFILTPMPEKAQIRIDGFSLENILQISSMEKKTQSLQVHCEDHQGCLDVDQGNLIHAETGTLHGLEAAMEILSWDNVQIKLIGRRPVDRTIHASLINVLLEASKRKDERNSSLAATGEDRLQEAIKQAEQHLYKEAHKNLVAYLKLNRNSTQGWIWYSRIQGNVESMKKSLDLAVSIAPEDPEVQEEVRKYTTARDHFKEGGVRKCFFCWTPLGKGVNCCHFCHCYLTVSRESLTQQRQADPRYLQEALDRYTRVLKRQPRHISAIYCLALIYLNKGNLEEALGYLDRTAKMAPDKAFFSNQLKLLLAYLARVEQAETVAQPEETKNDQEDLPGEVQKTILVIEDSSTTRKVISITLSRKGYRVIEAADGLEALSRISEERPDLIMLDVILPKMDGYKILSIIKGNKEFRDIPVIMLTSKDGFINKMKGKMAGSAAYLTKPFDPDRMINEIEKYI